MCFGALARSKSVEPPGPVLWAAYFWRTVSQSGTGRRWACSVPAHGTHCCRGKGNSAVFCAGRSAAQVFLALVCIPARIALRAPGACFACRSPARCAHSSALALRACLGGRVVALSALAGLQLGSGFLTCTAPFRTRRTIFARQERSCGVGGATILFQRQAGARSRHLWCSRVERPLWCMHICVHALQASHMSVYYGRSKAVIGMNGAPGGWRGTMSMCKLRARECIDEVVGGCWRQSCKTCCRSSEAHA